jgi:acetyltransferase-like isoleucine patch superfamily enzyme
MLSRLLRDIYYKYQSLLPYMNRVRYMLNRWKFKESGLKGSMAKNVKIRGRAEIVLGNRVAFREGVFIGGNGKLFIGDATSINENTIIACTQYVEIGSNCMFAPRCYVLDVDHKFSDASIPINQQGYEQSPVKIGDDVWFGTGVVVVKGVTIGNGCVIAANSVVTEDIPAYSIAAGSPARVLRSRHETLIS